MSISTPIDSRQISRSKLTFEIDNKPKIKELNSSIGSSNELLAGENISANSLVYIDSAGLIKLANHNSFAAVGFVSEDVLEDGPVNLIFQGIVSMPAHGFSIGSNLFLANGTPNIDNMLPLLSSGDILQQVGYVISADNIKLEIEQPITME